MSPNGRRRWRKWAKRLRRRLNREHGQSVVGETKAVGQIRRHAMRPPLLLPAPAFTPRSLVGATMGARKREALRDALHNADTAPAWLTKREASIVWSSFSPVVREGMRAWRETVRTKYRIGQRLRPCPGCYQCEQWRTCEGCGQRFSEDCEMCSAYAMDRYGWVCDGSGVLPAKGKRK